MADVTLSPNMNLPVPTVSSAPGPEWANSLNSCLSAIDSHDHSQGYGVPITPTGLDINSSLSMANNSLTATKAVTFQAQASLATLQSVYVSGVDLYYNDGSGNTIRITQSGNVAGSTGTITGLPSGTASASYQSGSGTFQFQSSTNTPANISGATILVGEQTTSPNQISIKSPTSLAGAYNFILPAALPASTKIMQLDTSGNVSAALVVDNSTLQNSANTLSVKSSGITATQLASDSVTTAKILDGAVTSAKLASSNYNNSSSSGTFSTTSASPVDVTNLSVSITTTGRPVLIFIGGNNANAGAAVFEANASGGSTATISGTWYVLRDGSIIHKASLSETFTAASTLWDIKVPMGFSIFDVPSAGAHTYKVQVSTPNAARMEYTVLTVVEL